ncbi:MAG: 6,7-dimethyl-8-ribityllumazine synthase [Bacteroidales bacterium]|nr:6,7-dimethyl-8-ribityllumazine synthase [Bacteroidales bacterium]
MTSVKKKNLSDFDDTAIPSGEGMKIGIVVSEWNNTITDVLAEGAVKTLRNDGVRKEDILMEHVPGSFELTLGAQWMAEYSNVDGVICLGCVIQGETPHFTYICQGVTQGITQLNIKYNIPFIFGVLTTSNMQQALDRAGGKHGNKGVEAAVTVLKMIDLKRNLI